MATATRGRAGFEDALARCVDEGVITADQARIVRDRARSAPGGRPPAQELTLEAMGYLGAAIAMAGALLVGARVWDDLGTAWRIAVLGTSAVALAVAGRAVPVHQGAGARVRAVLWVVSLGCLAGLLGVVGGEALTLGDQALALFVSGGCAAVAVAMWSAYRTPVQQVAMMVALAFTASAALSWAVDDADLPGLGVWGVGVLWVVLGATGALGPQRMTLLLGSATAVFGAMLTSVSDPGLVLTLVTIAAVVAGSIVLRDLVLLGIGALATLMNLPVAVTRWFPHSVVAAVVLVVVGLGLVVAAVVVASRPRDHRLVVPGGS